MQESRDLASLQALLNQINQVTPFGSLTFSGPVDRRGRRDPTQTTATQTLSPELQGLLSQLWGNQSAFGQAAGNRLGSLQGGPVTQPNIGQAPQFNAPNFGPGAQTGVGNPFNLLNVLPGGVNEDTFGEERSRVEGAVFDRAMSLLEPAWQQQDRRREQDLANRGLPMSGEAYQTDRSNTMRGRGETLNRLAMEAVLAGGQEQSRLLSDLLGTSQTGMGQASANRGQRFGEALQGYGANLQGYGANLQGQQLGMSADIANRQIPLQELMSLFGASQGNFTPQFANMPQTPVQSFATSGGMSAMQGLLGGAIGGAGALSSLGPWGALAGGLGGGIAGLFGR